MQFNVIEIDGRPADITVDTKDKIAKRTVNGIRLIERNQFCEPVNDRNDLDFWISRLKDLGHSYVLTRSRKRLDATDTEVKNPIRLSRENMKNLLKRVRIGEGEDSYLTEVLPPRFRKRYIVDDLDKVYYVLNNGEIIKDRSKIYYTLYSNRVVFHEYEAL